MNTSIAVGNKFQVEWRNFEPRRGSKFEPQLFFQVQLPFETILDISKNGTQEDYAKLGLSLIESLIAEKESWFKLGNIDISKRSNDDLLKGLDLP